MSLSSEPRMARLSLHQHGQHSIAIACRPSPMAGKYRKRHTCSPEPSRQLLARARCCGRRCAVLSQLHVYVCSGQPVEHLIIIHVVLHRKQAI